MKQYKPQIAPTPAYPDLKTRAVRAGAALMLGAVAATALTGCKDNEEWVRPDGNAVQPVSTEECTVDTAGSIAVRTEDDTTDPNEEVTAPTGEEDIIEFDGVAPVELVGDIAL